ncbi:hypothetical protein Tco_0407754 [Tanacetum coccineum]
MRRGILRFGIHFEDVENNPFNGYAKRRTRGYASFAGENMEKLGWSMLSISSMPYLKLGYQENTGIVFDFVFRRTMVREHIRFQILILEERQGCNCSLTSRLQDFISKTIQVFIVNTLYNMSTSNQQTLADSGANERPPMLERGNYLPWKSRFRRFLDNKLEEGERMWNSIQNRPYLRPMIPDPDCVVNLNGTVNEVLELLSKISEGNKKQYIADVKVMNYLLQAIPNDIYNSVDACKNAKEM